MGKIAAGNDGSLVRLGIEAATGMELGVIDWSVQFTLNSYIV